MKKITLLLLLLTATFGYSQEVLENFEGTAPTLNNFDGFGSSAVTANPTNASEKSLELITSATAAGWQGSQFVFQGKKLDLTQADKTITVNVHSTVATSILAKADGGENGAAASAADANHDGNGWQTLTFDFSVPKDNTVAGADSYASLVFFPAWNNEGGTCTVGCYAGSTVSSSPVITIYIDDVTGLGAAASETCSDGIMNNGETAIDCGGPNCDACPEPPTTAAPTPPARNAADVMSIYSEAYASVGLSNVSWDDGDTSPTTVAGNELLMMEAGNFLGQTIGTPVDASNMTHFHMDYYIADEFAAGQVFNSKLSNHEKPSGEAGESNALPFDVALTASDVKTWKSIDVALGDAKRGNIKEFLITVSNTVKLAYLDNIYLYRESTASVDNNALLGFSMYPNPASNRLNISAKEAIQNAAVYNVLGKKVMSLEINKSSESIDISNLASGIYLIKYNVNNKVGTAKFVKQ
jgi:hypothetical protein